jgi:AcrR family transcriptional regulator
VTSSDPSVALEPDAASAEFRFRLLDGMAAAIRERGFRLTTVADVVRHARTSRRTFYEHFTSKQDCYVALLRESNAGMIEQIAAAVDPHAPWDAQVRQAIAAWLGASESEPEITLSWIREIPSLGDDARQLQRDFLESFIVLIQTLSDSPELRAAGVQPVSRPVAIMLLGGLRELMATTVEDGGRLGDIMAVAVDATMAMIGPRQPANPTRQRSSTKPS